MMVIKKGYQIFFRIKLISDISLQYFVSFNEIWWNGGRTKQLILNETKPPISKMRQNRQFC